MRDRSASTRESAVSTKTAGSPPPATLHKDTPARKKTRKSATPVRSSSRAVKPTRSANGHSPEHRSPKPSKSKQAGARSDKAAAIEARNVLENQAVGPENRYILIAEAAYFLAERRGFEPGGELQDWLDAEAEIDEMLQCLAEQLLME